MTDSVGPRIARGVDQFVDPPRLEAVKYVDMRIRRDDRGLRSLRIEPDAPFGTSECPAIVRDGLAWIAGIAPPRQPCPGRVEGNGGVASGGHPPAQGVCRDSCAIGDELGPHEAGEGLGAATRDRNVEQHASIAGKQVSLPGGPHHRVPPPHEESVAGVAQGSRIVGRRRIVEELELALVAAVSVSEEETAVARPDRSEHADIGRVLDEAIRAAWCLVEIHDVRVRRRLGVDREPRAPDQVFVGTGVPE